jgi:hypothetical protein
MPVGHSSVNTPKARAIPGGCYRPLGVSDDGRADEMMEPSVFRPLSAGCVGACLVPGGRAAGRPGGRRNQPLELAPTRSIGWLEGQITTQRAISASNQPMELGRPSSDGWLCAAGAPTPSS